MCKSKKFRKKYNKITAISLVSAAIIIGSVIIFVAFHKPNNLDSMQTSNKNLYENNNSGQPECMAAQQNENNKEAKEVLVQRNMRLVAHISKKYNNSGEELDDLISIGTIGLIKAIDTFNVDKGIRLATYASKCIENEILMNIRSNKKNKMQVSLQDPIGVDKEGNAISLIDILGTDEDYVVDKVELKMKISKLYEKIEKVLTEREKEIIKLRYGLTPSGYKTQREIAQQLDISRSYVSRIEKKALKKLKRELNIDKNNINKKNKNDKDKTDKTYKNN